jgi:hypothetical protein
MNRRVPLFVVFALAVGFTLAGSSARVQAESFSGKWVHVGPKGTSTLEFFAGEKHVIGPDRGLFHHSIVLDDGRVIQGDGSYIFRHILPNRGWLILHFADGHVTREHEHIIGSSELELRHYGVTRTYLRQ